MKRNVSTSIRESESQQEPSEQQTPVNSDETTSDQTSIDQATFEQSEFEQPEEQVDTGICPSCGTTIGDKTICPNCGTAIARTADAPIASAATDTTPVGAETLKPLDQVLLERFEKDPPEAPTKRLPIGILAGVMVAIVAVAFIMWTVTKKEEIFAEGRTAAAHGEHHEGDGHDHGMTAADSAKLQEQLAILNNNIDSIQHHLEKKPNDDSARINLAIAFSIKGDYASAKEVYETHLAKHPNDANARVDYASVVIETTNDPRAGMAELERAITIDPKNPKALFNAAILSLQLREDHNAGFAKSREYLRRAKEASLKDNPTFASQIDMLIAEMDKKEKDIKAAKDSAAKAQ